MVKVGAGAKLREAEAFVRKALKSLGSEASDEEIRRAAIKTVKCLPPYRFRGRPLATTSPHPS